MTTTGAWLQGLPDQLQAQLTTANSASLIAKIEPNLTERILDIFVMVLVDYRRDSCVEVHL